MLNFAQDSFEQKYWDQIDQLCEEKVLVADASNHLDADCLLVKLGATVSKEKIDSMPNLRYIGMYGTGYGRIDDDYASTKNIPVCNIAGYSRQGVAELVFALVLEHIREIERAKKQAREGNYLEDSFAGTEIKDKIFSIIGLGNIGSRTAEIAKGFGADVKYWSRNRKPEYENKGIQYNELENIYKESDFISLHLAYNDDTKHFVDEKAIQSFKPGAIIINLSPMELIDINALENRLKQNDITFILDHSDELKEEEAKLLSQYKNCIMYPPIGYITKEATLTKKQMFIDNLKNFLDNGITNKVN